jgi:polyisoprenoid-binding protein YceI
MPRSILGAVLMSAVGVAGAAGDYVLDPAHTYPNFAIDHLGFSTIYGQFGATEGTLSIDPDAGTGSVRLVVDTSSVTTGHEKRDDSLRSPDFFNVVEFPEMTFESTGVTFENGTLTSVEGELTLMGVTKPLTLEVLRMKCAPHPMSQAETCGFDAVGSIMRSDFGINYGIPAIGEEVTLMIGVEAFKEAG